MKKCILYGLLFAVSSIGLSVYSSSNAQAATIFDDTVTPVETLVLDQKGYAEYIENADITHNWYSIMQNKNYGACTEQQLDSLDYAIDNGAWAVIGEQTTSNRNTEIYDNALVIWHGDKTKVVTFQAASWDKGALLPAGSYNYARITVTGTANNGSPDIKATCGSSSGTLERRLSTQINTNSSWAKRPLFSTFNIEYPNGYEGQLIPDSVAEPVEPEQLTPHYQWAVTPTGMFSIKYLGNLEHFLTGTSTLVIESMTENWESIDQSLYTKNVLPAGWLDEKWQLPEIGYYNIRVDHNQQLDSPPWEENHNYSIEQVWIQLYWDGQTAVVGNNTQDCDGICNTQRGNNSVVSPLFEGLDNLNTFGVTQFFTAPLNFLATLPAQADNCSPISFPLLGETISIECLKNRYYSWSSTIMNMYTTILIASTGYLIAFNVFRHIKDINTPDKDKIEVARL